MLAPTHVAFAILVATLGLSFFTPANYPVYYAWVIFGALLVDIDHQGSTINKILPLTRRFSVLFKHRGIFHSIWAPIFMFFPVAYLTTDFTGYAFVLGYCSHLVSDSLTKQGINFLHPFSQFKIAGPITTGTWQERIVLVLCLGAIAVVVF